jgi:hypothetical protein
MAKDVGAMSVRGDFLFIGVDNRGRPNRLLRTWKRSLRRSMNSVIAGVVDAVAFTPRSRLRATPEACKPYDAAYDGHGEVKPGGQPVVARLDVLEHCVYLAGDPHTDADITVSPQSFESPVCALLTTP